MTRKYLARLVVRYEADCDEEAKELAEVFCMEVEDGGPEVDKAEVEETKEIVN